MIRFDDGSHVSDPGSPVEVVYAPKVLDNGEIELIETGLRNTDEEIQSYKDSTDIRLILARCEAGDYSGLNVKTPLYGDFTEMPKTYAEVLQLQIDSNNLFDSLPADVRYQFDNDPNKFFAASGTKEWYQKIEKVLPDDVKKVVLGDMAVKPVVEEPVFKQVDGKEVEGE